jgi:glycosyltransferase involved in cell wall biosynthesis
MKVLWLSNRIFETSAEKQSGTWLKSLATALSSNPGITLVNISTSNVQHMTRMDYQRIVQWAVPHVSLRRDGLPNAHIVNLLKKAVAEFEPDIIQVWGTEGYWGLLTARKILTGQCILSIQGVLNAILPVYNGGLSLQETFQCIGLREILRPYGSLFLARKKFEARALFEQEIIRGHKFIVTQSLWSKGQVSAISPFFISYRTERTLREEFVNAEPWQTPKNAGPVLFTSCAGRPYKGMHVLIKAVGVLKRRFPNIRLYISGAHIPTRIRMSGYDKWLRKIVGNLGLNNNVAWLGDLSADEIIANLHRCNVFINPSFIESYSLSLAEAMYLGVPSVVSYAGAMPELAVENQSALFFSPGDYVGCATKIEYVLADDKLSNEISRASRLLGVKRNNAEAIVDHQLYIYKSVLNGSL